MIRCKCLKCDRDRDPWFWPMSEEALAADRRRAEQLAESNRIWELRRCGALLGWRPGMRASRR